MILAKTNTDTFGTKVPDSTPVEEVHPKYFLINGFIFQGPCEAGHGFLDGVELKHGEKMIYYSLVSKADLKWNFAKLPKEVLKKLAHYVTYNTSKVSLAHLRGEQ